MNTRIKSNDLAYNDSRDSIQTQLWQYYLTLCAWHQRAKTRVALSKLEARLLDDIGISELSAKTESQKAFWQD